jgi:hypothetical protein
MAKEDQTPQTEEHEERLELVHPVYLDTPMMVSFVAALEGGVSYGAESTQTQAQTEDKAREGGGRFGVPILSSLLSLDMSGRMSSNVGAQNTEEVKVVRRHTEASLFNLLRHRLISDGEITTVTTRGQLSDLRPGQLIEVSGEVIGNPLQQLFALMTKILPYMGIEEEEIRGPAKGKQAKGNPRSGNPAQRAAAQQGLTKDEQETLDGIRMLFIMKDDLEVASVRDVVLAADDSITTVLTLSTEFFSDQTTDYVLGGRFTVLGKVTRILAGEDTVNLTRRTALGIAGPDMAREIVDSFTEDNEFFIEATDPIVTAPALQVLPLALFV